MRKVLLAAVAVMMLAALVSCATRGYTSGGGDISDRIDNQQDRINAGISDGSLTRSEADIVQDNLNWIRREFSRAKSDGVVTRGEYDRITADLNHNDQMIYNKRHNPVRRMH